MISIIIPAYNEEKVIENALKELISGVDNTSLELIVVCNGCSDNTANVVASFGKKITLIDTPVPSKTNALNLGDSTANGFPRIYQDADVVLTLDAVHKIAQVLEGGQFLAAAPKMRMDYSNASRPVRYYYDIWQRLPYVKEGMIGTGVYALSKKGRDRFTKFPDVIADDGFIRGLFKSNERTSVESCHSLVSAPATIADLLKIKARSRLGGYELKEKFPELLASEAGNYGKALVELIPKIYLWPKILIYLYVNLKARYRAKKYTKKLGYTGWERDDSRRKAD